jgi:transcriptional regulator with XRE-family HTH domain
VKSIEEKKILIMFGLNLAKLRKSKGFTQAELANDTEMEISQISRIERGVLNTSIINLYYFSKTLKIDINDFFDFNRS